MTHLDDAPPQWTPTHLLPTALLTGSLTMSHSMSLSSSPLAATSQNHAIPMTLQIGPSAVESAVPDPTTMPRSWDSLHRRR